MLATVSFPSLSVQVSNGVIVIYTQADTAGTRFSAGGWHLPATHTAGASASLWTCWRKQTLDLKGITGLENQAVMPVNFISSQSGLKTIGGSPDGSMVAYDLTFLTTEPMKEEIAPSGAGASWLPPQSFPFNVGFLGGPIDADRVLYGELRTSATNRNVPTRILVNYDMSVWGSGELIATDEVFAYRCIMIASDATESATTYTVQMPAMNLQIPLMDAGLDEMGYVMQLYRNLGQSVAGERLGAI